MVTHIIIGIRIFLSVSLVHMAEGLVHYTVKLIMAHCRRNKKKVLLPRFYPPEGWMLYDNKEHPVNLVELGSRKRMRHWDSMGSNARQIGTTLIHWSKDPSYNWNRRPYKKRKL